MSFIPRQEFKLILFSYYRNAKWKFPIFFKTDHAAVVKNTPKSEVLASLSLPNCSRQCLNFGVPDCILITMVHISHDSIHFLQVCFWYRLGCTLLSKAAPARHGSGPPRQPPSERGTSGEILCNCYLHLAQDNCPEIYLLPVR